MYDEPVVLHPWIAALLRTGSVCLFYVLAVTVWAPSTMAGGGSIQIVLSLPQALAVEAAYQVLSVRSPIVAEVPGLAARLAVSGAAQLGCLLHASLVSPGGRLPLVAIALVVCCSLLLVGSLEVILLECALERR